MVTQSPRSGATGAEGMRLVCHLGDLKQDKILKSMRRFAEEVMPAFRT